MAITPQEIQDLLKKNLPEARVEILDLAGDGDHYAIHVTYRGFAGKTRIEQHKMVYEALEGKVGGKLHALSVKTSV